MEAQKDYAFPHIPMANAPGMTLRDWFASNAPPMDDDWASYRRTDENTHHQEMLLRAEWAYIYADAMIAAREKKPA